MESLTKSLEKFTSAMYKALLVNEKGNIVFSPWSIMNGFAMVLAGAQGSTRTEILNVLNLDEEAEKGDTFVHKRFEDVRESLRKACTDKTFLDEANKLWVTTDFKVLDSYLSLLRSNYDIDVGEVDFPNDSTSALKEINKWVEAQTHNKIQNLFPDGSLNSLTRLALANAVYFKGLWEIPFNKKETRKATFFISEKESVDVDMMFVNGKFRLCYDKALSATVVELPYIDKRFSMILLLPREKMGYKLIEEHLGTKLFSNWQLQASQIHLYLPKFLLSEEITLKDVLSEMGLKTVFCEKNADLSGITGSRNLYVSCAFHKAYVEVDEAGTEASAATGIGIAVRSLPMQVRADHPFFFMIRENGSNAVLFFGKVINPSS